MDCIIMEVSILGRGESLKKLNNFGWRSKISLQYGIDETINYYIENYKYGL